MVQNLSVQDMADVAAYIEQLPMAPYNGIGPGVHLAHGERLYQEHCADCHGVQGEGNARKNMPLIQGQHYRYLVRQFRWIKNGKRRNADEDMLEQAQTFTGHDISAVMDYTSRIRPPAEKTAQPGWQNGDFADFVRPPLRQTQ
jgi:cytochrome c553